MTPKTKKLLVLSVVSLVCFMIGCGPPRKKRFELQNGEVVHCSYSSRYHCGLSLYGCDDGHSYECMIGVKK